MLLDFETAETLWVKEWLRVNQTKQWTGTVTDLLCRYDREIAIGKLAEALQMALQADVVIPDGLAGELYLHALQKVDFYFLGLQLVKAAETADPSLIQAQPVDEAEEEMELMD